MHAVNESRGPDTVYQDPSQSRALCLGVAGDAGVVAAEEEWGEEMSNNIVGPLSGVQVLAISHPYTANRDRTAVIRNQEKTLGQVGSMSERWANRYLNEHPLGRQLAQKSEAEYFNETR